MPIKHLHKFLSAPDLNRTGSQVRFWFSLSLTFAAVYGWLGLRQAFVSEYVVQDDARQHVFWMQQFLDPELFPDDLIADYFQSVAPEGYATFYHLFATVGIDPVFLSKLLPVVLGLIATGYGFAVCLQMLPVPAAGLVATLLLNQSIWSRGEFSSATPRAFLYPLFLAFLYYLLRRSLWGVSIAIMLLGLFYPQYVFISAGLLVLQLRRNRLLSTVGLGVAFVVMLPYAVTVSEFEPVITASEAKTMPEFLPGGRSRFFYDDPGKFWLTSSRSGMLPWFNPPLICAGFLLPVVLRFSSVFPLVKQVKSSVTLLAQIVLVALCMFFAAHALLFKLHLPSRYTWQSLEIVLAIASGIALIIILDAVFCACQRNRQVTKSAKVRFREWLALGATALLGIVLFTYPNDWETFPDSDYIVGKAPALYEFFYEQPKDILIASIAKEANNLPTFSQRSILVGREYAIPYHLGYYLPFRQRLFELIQAQYSSDLGEAQAFIEKYGIDFWLLKPAAFTPDYLTNHHWIEQFQLTKDALARLEQGITPALSKTLESCSVLETREFVVLQASCITESKRD